MSSIICIRCRQPLDEQTGLCPVCLPIQPAEGKSLTDQPNADPGLAEQQFLLERGTELTDPSNSRFLGFSEEELRWRASRVPRIPLSGFRYSTLEERPKETLLSKLHAGQKSDRGAAALQLARFREPDVVFGLLRRLMDREADVRQCVVWALGRIGHSLVVGPLIEFQRVEKDVSVRAQTAATLYWLLVVRPSRGLSMRSTDREEIKRLGQEILASPSPELHVQRGRLHMRFGQILKAIGDFTRAMEPPGSVTASATFFRSQAFLILGKPLLALDDLLLCPSGQNYPATFELHKKGLVTLAGQIVTAARAKGLEDYANLYEKRLVQLRDPSEEE